MVEAHLAAPRVATYLDACDGDLVRALLLYRWNARVAAELREALGHTEVLLRNTIHDALTVRHQHRREPGYWFDDPRRELDARAHDEIDTARRRARRRVGSAAVPSGKVVAELPFGFWRYLLAKRYISTLSPAGRHGFPQLPGRDRTRLERPVIRLHLPNRIAHHEPLIRENLPTRLADLEYILDAIDPALRRWVRDDGDGSRPRSPVAHDLRPANITDRGRTP